jgi:hypothetical protein
MSEMKLIIERWDRFLIKEQEEESQTLGQKAAAGLGKISSIIAKGFNKMDDYVRQDYCEKKFPLHLKGQGGDIQTWGDLQALLKCGSEYQNKKQVLNTLASFVPGVSAAMGVIQKSSEISDLIIGAYQMDDESRPEGAIGKLDMDDEVADIIDDKIEKAFIQFLIQEISDTKNLEQDIDANWNITNALKAFLAREKNNRTITGFEKG